MILPGDIGVHRRKVDSAFRNRIEYSHQCALRVAVADVKDLHGQFPLLAFCDCAIE